MSRSKTFSTAKPCSTTALEPSSTELQRYLNEANDPIGFGHYLLDRVLGATPQGVLALSARLQYADEQFLQLTAAVIVDQPKYIEKMYEVICWLRESSDLPVKA